jgi:flagellar biosynthesis/type III secretory pathway M-ring protein FliF/YscJ
MVAVGVALLFLGFRAMRRKKPEMPEAAKELEAPLIEQEPLPVIPQEFAPPPVLEETVPIPERARELARRDATLAANVVRLWLQEGKART